MSVHFKPFKDFKPSDYCRPPDAETHAFHMKQDKEFKDACDGANIQVTKLAYRKWTQKRGKAWQWHQENKIVA